MAKPVFLAENFFNEIQNPTHVVTANNSAPDHEPWHVGNGRRHPSDYAAPTTVGADYEIRVDLGVAKTFDFFALDRGHNLGAVPIRFEKSSDNFATNVVPVVSATPPAESGGSPSDADGCHTSEGAWIRRLSSPESTRYLRLFVPGLGGLTPRVVGLWAGLSWEPMEYMALPLQDRDVQLTYAQHQSRLGWQGIGVGGGHRSGSITIPVGEGEEDEAERFVTLIAERPGVPFWFVTDLDAPTKSVLAYAPPQLLQFGKQKGWSRRQVGFRYEELQPRRR